MSRPRWRLQVLSVAGLGTAVLASQGSAASISANAMKACAAIAAPSERLACYDQLAGREAPSGVPATLAGAPLAAAPAAVPAAPASPAPGSPPSPPPAAQPTKEAFGLYAAEHPTIPKRDETLTAVVVGFGIAPNGHPTVTLEGGQLWELDSADPVLKNGESVTIARAALGSFLMTTTAGRTHRVRRLH
jgi:hypothetical protein